MSILKDFKEWIRPTLEGDDGKASHRRITVLHCMLLLTFMTISVAAWGTVFPDVAWYVFSGGAGLFSGLSVWQQMVNKRKDEGEDKTITDIHITDTISK